MTLSAATMDFLARVERHAGRSLRFREEVGSVIALGIAGSGKAIVDELLFRAKFVSRSRDLLSRIGPDSPDAALLAAEFRSSVEHVTELIRTLISPLEEGARAHLEKNFLSLSQESLGNLMTLCKDMSMIKNFTLDTGETGSTA